MKRSIIFLSIVYKCLAISEFQMKEKWNHFLKMTNKSYDAWEIKKRFDIFAYNVKMMENHNRRYQEGKEHFEMGVGPFADKTADEFKEFFEMHRNPFRSSLDKAANLTSPANRNASVPFRADYRNIMQPIKDQRNCNAGWAFAAVAAVESVAMMSLQYPISLSEQNLIDCAYGERFTTYGCDGGSLLGAFSYMRTNGIDSTLNYPYSANISRCRNITNAPVQTLSIHKIQESETELMKAVGTHGPVAATIEVTPTIMHYKRGIIFDPKCRSTTSNHAVTVVGYGIENGYQYWLLRNSWGDTWGDKGYFKLARNYMNNCRIGKIAYYADLS